MERLQVAAWRKMSPADKLALVGNASRAALELSLAGVRQRHPDASPRECFIHLALLTLGPILARAAYPELISLDDPKP